MLSPTIMSFCLWIMISLAVIIAEIIFYCRCYLDELLDDYYMVFVIIMSVLYFLFPAIFSNTVKTSSSTTAGSSSLLLSQALVLDQKAIIITRESCVNEEDLLRNTAQWILKLSKKKARAWKKNRKVTVPLRKRVFVTSIGKQAQEILLR